MSFNDTLNNLLQDTPHSLAATLMGYDGISIITVQGKTASTSLDINALFVEYSSLLNQIREAAKMFETGLIKEVIISTENLSVILRVLTEEYFAALVLTPEANIGRGRYKMRVAAPKLASEL